MENYIEETFEYLSEEYGFSISKIKEWYNLLSKYPCFYGEKTMSCLEVLCRRRMADKICRTFANKKIESLQEAADAAIYETYSSESLEYLDENFIDNYSSIIDNEDDLSEGFTRNGLDEAEFDILEREDYISTYNKSKVYFYK